MRQSDKIKSQLQ